MLSCDTLYSLPVVSPCGIKKELDDFDADKPTLVDDFSLIETFPFLSDHGADLGNPTDILFSELPVDDDQSIFKDVDLLNNLFETKQSGHSFSFEDDQLIKDKSDNTLALDIPTIDDWFASPVTNGVSSESPGSSPVIDVTSISGMAHSFADITSSLSDNYWSVSDSQVADNGLTFCSSRYLTGKAPRPFGSNTAPSYTDYSKVRSDDFPTRRGQSAARNWRHKRQMNGPYYHNRSPRALPHPSSLSPGAHSSPFCGNTADVHKHGQTERERRAQENRRMRNIEASIRSIDSFKSTSLHYFPRDRATKERTLKAARALIQYFHSAELESEMDRLRQEIDSMRYHLSVLKRQNLPSTSTTTSSSHFLSSSPHRNSSRHLLSRHVTDSD